MQIFVMAHCTHRPACKSIAAQMAEKCPIHAQATESHSDAKRTHEITVSTFGGVQAMSRLSVSPHRCMRILALLLAGACVAQAQTQPLERRLSAVTDGEKCNCNPKTDISQYTTCKLERNPFGMMAVVVSRDKTQLITTYGLLVADRSSLDVPPATPTALLKSPF